MAADEGCDDEGPEFRPPLPPEDRIWRHPAELGAMHAVGDHRSGGRSPWALGFVSVIGGVLLAGSLMFGIGGIGDEPSRIALKPFATVEPLDDPDEPITKTATSDVALPSQAVFALDVTTGELVRSGNAIVLRPDGYLVTTATLVSGAIDIRVTDDAGGQHTGRVVGVDTLNDLAVVQIDSIGLAPVRLDPTVDARAGDQVRVIGASRGVAHVAWDATVSLTDARLVTDTVDLHAAAQLDRVLDPAASGAVVIGPGGDVLGMATASAPDGTTYVIPPRTLTRVGEQLVTWGEARHGWMGVEGVSAPDNGGALVRGIVEGGPASAAGLLAGDRIVAFDGEPIATMSELVVAVRERQPGKAVAIEIVRDATPLQLQLTLARAPQP
ncbi:MAG TPA: S1C family serine protease [Acidimicrobiales bacterium]